MSQILFFLVKFRVSELRALRLFMKPTKLSVPNDKNGKSSPIPIVIDYPDGNKKVDTAIVLTHGASGDYSTGNLPLLGEL